MFTLKTRATRWSPEDAPSVVFTVRPLRAGETMDARALAERPIPIPDAVTQLLRRLLLVLPPKCDEIKDVVALLAAGQADSAPKQGDVILAMLALCIVDVEGLALEDESGDSAPVIWKELDPSSRVALVRAMPTPWMRGLQGEMNASSSLTPEEERLPSESPQS